MTHAGKAAATRVTGLRPLLEAGLQQIGLKLDASQIDSLLVFGDLLLRWNRTYNLTAIKAPRDVVTHHLLDCLAIVPALERELSRASGRRILDVGSGAGLPGLVIAIADPAAHVVCVDSVGKKAAFITQAIATLGLRNAEAVHTRIETLQAPGFDVIVSRAFSSLPAFTHATERLLNPGAVWIAMKGKAPGAEVDKLGVSFVAREEPIRVLEVDAERCIVVIGRRSELGCERTLMQRPPSRQEKHPS